MGRAVAGHTHARRLFRNVTMIFSRPRSECSGRRQDTDCVTGLCSLKQGVEMAPGGIGRRLVLGGSPLQCQGRCVLAAPRPRSALAGDRPLHRLLPGRSHRSVLWFRATVLLLPATLRVRSPPRAGGELPCSALRVRAARAACRAWRGGLTPTPGGAGVRRRGPRSWSRGSSTGLLGLPHRMAAWLPAPVTGAGRGLRGLSPLSLGCHLIQASRCGTQTGMPGSQEGAPLGFSTQPPAIRATCPSWRCPAGAGARCVPCMSLRGCFRAHKTTVVL